jgi:hypothetical protein
VVHCGRHENSLRTNLWELSNFKLLSVANFCIFVDAKLASHKLSNFQTSWQKLSAEVITTDIYSSHETLLSRHAETSQVCETGVNFSSRISTTCETSQFVKLSQTFCSKLLFSRC